MRYATDVILYLSPRITPQVASSEKHPFISLLNVEKNREGVSKVTFQYNFFPPRMIYYGEKSIDYKAISLK